MKKEIPYKYTVKRINSSPYFESNFSKAEKLKLESIAHVVMLDNSNEDADILITNTHSDLSLLSSNQIKSCKLIIHPNSGYDNFSTTFVESSQFPIVLGNSLRAHAVTNYILSALFSHYGSIPEQHTWNKDRKWPRKLLNELNVLVLGQGHIGSILQQCLSPLVASLNIYDPFKNLNQLTLKDIDVVIPVCSLNPSSKHIINMEKMMKLSEDFLLINAARGALINTIDLLEILTQQPNAHAVLDVFEKEPIDFAEFNKLKNIKTTSHIAGVYSQLNEETIQFEFNTIEDFIKMEIEEFKKNYSHIILQNKLRNNFLI